MEPAQWMLSHPARQRPSSPPWHCSVPSRGRDPGLLEKSKRNKENKQKIQQQTEKMNNHQNRVPVCPCQGWSGHLLQQKALVWGYFFFFFFWQAVGLFLTLFIINLKENTIQPSQQQTKRKSRHRKRNAIGSGLNACHGRCHLPFGKPQGKMPILQLGRRQKAEKGAERSTNRNHKERTPLI